MGIDWRAYYEREDTISDFNPETDPSGFALCESYTT